MASGSFRTGTLRRRTERQRKRSMRRKRDHCYLRRLSLLVSTDTRRRRIHSGLRRADPFEEKALEPPRVEVLTDVDVAPAVDGNRVRHIQRSTKETLLPE